MGKGKWVKFPAPPDAFPGAHRSRDGQVVGIFTPAGVDSLTKTKQPARVNVVALDTGHNLIELHDGGARNVTIDLETTQITLAVVPEDCPIERVRHLMEAQ